MPDIKVAMTVRKPAASFSIVDIEGEVTSFCEEVLMDAYSEAVRGGAKTVILDFEGLDYMNSGGIGLIVTLLIRAQRQGQKLMACGLNDHYQQIFSLTRLNEAITIFPDEAAAVAAAS